MPVGAEQAARRAADDELLARALAGHQHSIARLLTKVERSLADAAEVMELVAPLPRRGRAVGLIGPPGAGKSTLVGVLAAAVAAGDQRVAIVANDPTGAESGGALLGDRVRMKSLSRDPRVFIRSAAARDPLRSLGPTTLGSVEVLARLGFDYVLVEAVGAGQSDIGTRLVADTTVLVLVPGLGDDVQAMKSGIMEVADVFVVNKSDLPDAKKTAITVRQAVKAARRDEAAWVPPVLNASAAEEDGIEGILEAVDRHAAAHAEPPPERVAALNRDVIVDLVTYECSRRLRRDLPRGPQMEEQLRALEAGRKHVIKAALEIADALLPPR